MSTVCKCTNENAAENAARLQALEKYFCLLDNEGDSVLNHAVYVEILENVVALGIISRSKHFHTIKGIQNKGGEYAVFNAAVEGKVDILNFFYLSPTTAESCLLFAKTQVLLRFFTRLSPRVK